MRMATSYICLSGFNAKNAISQLKMGWPIERKAGKISEAAIKQLRLLKELDKQNAGGSKISS